jgi:hypothetical protein
MRILAVLAMTALFLWQASAAIEKYHSKVTSLQVIHTGKYIFAKFTNSISSNFWAHSPILNPQIYKTCQSANSKSAIFMINLQISTKILN